MQEYATEAIVLDMFPSGDYDARYSLFTRKYGKLVVRAKSVKKPLSKLAGHLQIGNVIRARIIEQKGLQVVDALKQDLLNIIPSDLYFLDRVVHEAEPDYDLWQLLAEGNFTWTKALKIFGWDPERAVCAGCAGRDEDSRVMAFHIRTQEFYCARCSSKVRRSEVILL